MEKEAMGLKDIRERHMGMFAEGKREGGIVIIITERK